MRRAGYFFSMLLLLPQFACAQLLLQGRVVDSEEGKPLPFARVQLSNNHVTLSNREGYFAIMGTEDDELTISYVAFEKITVKADSLPATIRLKPLVSEMSEVVVLPQPKEDILELIRKKLRKDYVANWKKTNLYFFRTFTARADSTKEMLEGFYDAYSAVNIGRPLIISGQTRLSGKADAKAFINTNFHKLFLLGPIVYEEDFWKQALQPLGESEDVKKAYDADITTMRNEEGRRIYKIKFLFNGWAPKDWYGRALIQGTLFVDAETYGVLHFDGEVLGMRQLFDGERMAMELTFHVDYSHERGYTEVTHISFDGGTPAVSYHCLLFKVDEGEKGTEWVATANLVEAIKNAGYDGSLWDKYDIVKRTEEEERTAKSR